jgi:hypothetical protein
LNHSKAVQWLDNFVRLPDKIVWPTGPQQSLLKKALDAKKLASCINDRQSAKMSCMVRKEAKENLAISAKYVAESVERN